MIFFALEITARFASTGKEFFKSGWNIFDAIVIGISLVAETNEGVFYVGEAVSNPAKSSEGVSVPEEIAQKAAYELLNDIYRGGCASTINQSLMTTLMAFGDRDLSKTILGPLTPYSIQFLRHIKDFTALTFKLEPQNEQMEVDDDYDEEEEVEDGS